MRVFLQKDERYPSVVGGESPIFGSHGYDIPDELWTAFVEARDLHCDIEHEVLRLMELQDAERK